MTTHAQKQAAIQRTIWTAFIDVEDSTQKKTFFVTLNRYKNPQIISDPC